MDNTFVTNPLSSVVRGMLMGSELGMRLQHERRTQEAFERAKAREDEESGIRDLENRIKIASLTRPVDDLGLVTDKMQIGESAPGLGPITIDAPRKAKNVITYKSRTGETVRGEPLSEDELFRRQVQRATEAKRAGATPVNTPEHLRALGLGPVIYVPDAQVPNYANVAGSLQPVETPTFVQDMGLPKTTTYHNLPGMVSAGVRGLTLKQQAEQAEANREQKQQQFETAERGRYERVRTQQQGAAERARVRESGANSRAQMRSSPTGGQAGVENRFRTRLQENDQKEVRQLQQEEQNLHAEKLKIGQSMATMTDEERKEAPGKLSALDLQIKAKQARQRQLINKWGGQTAQSSQSGVVLPKEGPTPAKQAIAAAEQSIQEGTIVKNPKTGERLVLKGGAWVPVQQ